MRPGQAGLTNGGAVQGFDQACICCGAPAAPAPESLAPPSRHNRHLDSSLYPRIGAIRGHQPVCAGPLSSDRRRSAGSRRARRGIRGAAGKPGSTDPAPPRDQLASQMQIAPLGRSSPKLAGPSRLTRSRRPQVPDLHAYIVMPHRLFARQTGGWARYGGDSRASSLCPAHRPHPRAVRAHQAGRPLAAGGRVLRGSLSPARRRCPARPRLIKRNHRRFRVVDRGAGRLSG